MPPEVKTLQIDRTVFQQTLEKKLADLPPLPAVVTRILHTINDPDTSAEDLNRLISLDQGLSSKILRIVNSAYYGFPKRISTITHAVVILGFNTVRNLVLGVSAFGMLSSRGGASALDRTRFWEHSIATAVAASIIAKKRRPGNRSVIEEAFIGGLLHDIGKMFLDCYFPVQYAVTMAFAERENISVLDAERRVLGLDHAAVGRKIAEQWNFPPMLIAAVGAHHLPPENSDHFDISAIIQAADWMAWSLDHGSSRCSAPTMSEAVESWLGFSEEDHAIALREWENQFAAARDLLQMGQDDKRVRAA